MPIMLKLGDNDVRLRERTSALQGSYKSADEIKMQSTVYPNDIEILVDKPVGTKYTQSSTQVSNGQLL